MRTIFLNFILVFVIVFAAQAAGPLYVGPSGEGSAWNGEAILYHPESGSCASFNNAAMLTRLQTLLAKWQDLTESDITFVETLGQVPDVDGDNYGDYLSGFAASDEDLVQGDGLNPVVFDDDGDIIAAIAGESNRFAVLGFAGPSSFNDDYTEIESGQAVVNCRCLAGNPNGACVSGGNTIVFTEDELDFTVVHEMGHFLNLDHTQVNAALVDSDDDNDADIPSMYPIAENAEEQKNLQRDDVVSAALLYPSAEFATTTCTVFGIILDQNANPLRCADVQAIAEDAADNISTVSGYYAVGTDENGDSDTVDEGECLSGCGDFSLRLEVGKAYTIKVMPIDELFIGGSGIGPCFNAQKTGIVEEVIETLSSGQCTANGTINLGSYTTSSTGGEVSSGGAGGGENSDDPTFPIGITCSLQQNHDSSEHATRGAFFVVILGALMLLNGRRIKT